MYKYILVITDNKFICSRVDEILAGIKYKEINWSFAVSPASELEEFHKLVPRAFRSVNMKNELDVQEIINNYDLVISIHCKQLFPNKLIEAVKCINVHPGYNPINRGWYPQVFAILNNLPVGATIHEIDSEIDHGNIIAREFVEKDGYQNSLQLYTKIVDKEIELLHDNIEKIILNTYNKIIPESEGNLFLKRDFESLKQMDLEKQATYGEVIQYLLAFTHGDFKNAWFKDARTGKKYTVSINLHEEE